MGGDKLFDEIGKQSRVPRFARGRVVLHEVAAAAAQNLADRHRCEIGDAWDDVVRAEKIEDFIDVAEEAAIEGVDEKGVLVGVAPDDKVTGKSDWLEFELQTLRYKEVDDA